MLPLSARRRGNAGRRCGPPWPPCAVGGRCGAGHAPNAGRGCDPRLPALRAGGVSGPHGGANVSGVNTPELACGKHRQSLPRGSRRTWQQAQRPVHVGARALARTLVQPPPLPAPRTETQLSLTVDSTMKGAPQGLPSRLCFPSLPSPLPRLTHRSDPLTTPRKGARARDVPSAVACAFSRPSSSGGLMLLPPSSCGPRPVLWKPQRSQTDALFSSQVMPVSGGGWSTWGAPLHFLLPLCFLGGLGDAPPILWSC